MKKYIFLTTGLLLLLLCICHTPIYSQVGVNTLNPVGAFHVDTKGNSNTVLPATLTDDVVILTDGKVGLGTTSPATTLDINGSLRISDGTQQTGRILATSDGTGLASWRDISDLTYVRGAWKTGVTITYAPGSYVDVTQTPLRIGKGKWLVIARVQSKANAASSYYSWIQLYNTTTGTVEEQTGVTAETTGARWATPSITTIVSNPSNTIYELRVRANNACNCMEIPTNTANEFYAIKVE